MSQYFFTGTPLWELEREMMSVPNFDHREEKKITDCQLCSQYKPRQPCLLVRCPYINARMLRGDLSLDALAWSMYRRYPNLLKRLDVFLLDQELRFFRHESHRQRWQRWRDRFYRMSKENKAALYLLTAYDAVREILTQTPIRYPEGKDFLPLGEEADVLNMALFGMTAKQWRDRNPDSKGNIRDYANVSQLVCLSNLENLNAVFINEGMPQSERLAKLNAIAISQMEILTQDHRLEQFEEVSTQKQLDGSFVSADDSTAKE